MGDEQRFEALAQRLLAALEPGQKEIRRRLDRIEHRLTHDDGLVVRVDRLEQQAKMARRSIATISVALFGFIVDWFRK